MSDRQGEVCEGAAPFAGIGAFRLGILVAGSAGGGRPGVPGGRSSAEAVVFELRGDLEAFKEVQSKEA